ncbi:MAG TPA: methyltransferase domain-containing protein [Anditalea sp.]|nr:methyltransferase domain-containing protein [Anditalea sp.]
MTDEEFDALYPIKMRKLSSTHWTPVTIAMKAVDFLVKDRQTKVLDLGSGAGKFCIVAAMKSGAVITGIEQRENLVILSRKLAKQYKLTNVDFILGNIKDIEFSAFDGFYFFNSFQENVDLTDKIDPENSHNTALYEQYRCLLKDKLDKVPIGTRVVTYCGEGGVIPDSYAMLGNSNKGKLLFWEKRY